MKFLIDLRRHRLATFLRSEGHDVEEARDRGPGDQVLLEWAVAERRVLVTMIKISANWFSFTGRNIMDWFACPMCPPPHALR